MFKIMNEQPRPLERLRAEVPPALAAAVARALHKSPERRFKDVPAFARAIAPFLRVNDLVLRSPRLETVVSESFGGRPRLALPRKAAVAFVFGCLVGAAVLALGVWAKHRRAAPGSESAPRLVNASLPRPSALPAAALPTPSRLQLPPGEATVSPVRADASLPASRPTPSAQATARKTPSLPASARPFPSRRFDPQNPYSQ
jgi:hypothetical protein